MSTYGRRNTQRPEDTSNGREGSGRTARSESAWRSRIDSGTSEATMASGKQAAMGSPEADRHPSPAWGHTVWTTRKRQALEAGGTPVEPDRSQQTEARRRGQADGRKNRGGRR